MNSAYIKAHYKVTINTISEDGAILYHASVREFPYLDEFGNSLEEAYELIYEAIEASISILSEKGGKIPAPIQDNEDVSGRVTLRMSKSLHHRVGKIAEVEGISLNSLICEYISIQSAINGRADSAYSDSWMFNIDQDLDTCTETVTSRKVIPVAFKKNQPKPEYLEAVQ